MRLFKVAAVRAALSIFCSLVLLTTAYARADEPAARPFDISAQSLATALSEFARQSQQEILFAPEVVAQKHSSGVRGTMQPLAALKLLLKDSALTFTTTANGAVLVGSPPSGATPRSSGEEKVAPKSTGEDATKESRTREGTQQRNIDDRFRLAQADQGKSSSDRLAEKQDGQVSREKFVNLEEIIVTAQKHNERLMDVPTSISAIGGERLEALHVNSLSDLAGYVPGMSVSSIGAPGERNIVIRGISGGYEGDLGGPLVGTYIDDLPINTSTASGRGSTSGLDLMPYDIERIEVLKGPQGTLYGGNTMGGLVKYSLRQPGLTEFDARAGGDLQYVDNSRAPDWGLRGVVNVPIVVDKLALRLSGFDQTTAGYIDNTGTGIKGANHSTEKGGRVALLWQATDHLAILVNFLGQNTDARDLGLVAVNGATRQPLYGPQILSTFFPEPFKQKTRFYSVSIDWDLGLATLSSSSGWSQLNNNVSVDYTIPYGQYAPGNPDALALYQVGIQGKKFVEEVRLTSNNNLHVQWMLGGYYTKEDTAEQDTFPTFTPTYVPLPVADNLLISNASGVYKERAAFANVTYKFNDRFDLSGGERYSSYTQVNCSVSSGLFGAGATPCTNPPAKGVSTWMADARFHVNQDAMLYARVATGYRPGTPNVFATTISGGPPQSNPDRTKNYEVGFKGQFFDRRLQLDLSMFAIDWSDIQAQVLGARGLAFIGNGGSARSSGFELNTNYLITDGLQVNATLAYTDAHLTQDAPSLMGKNGDQLAVAPRWAGSLVADYRRPLDGGLTLILGGGYRYRDTVVSQFPGTGYPAPLPPQNIVDLYTGVEFARAKLRLYGKNVFNNRSYAGLNFLNQPQKPNYVPVLPRTIGLEMDYQF